MRAQPVVVAGAGIGGLTFALALAARGIECVVLEKSAELATIGAGVQLSPNASTILIGLGLRDVLAATATVPEAVVLNSVRGGGEIARLALEQKADAPYWVIHRADLQAALRGAAEADARITLRLGEGVDRFRAGADGVQIMMRDETVCASTFIAADGVGSGIRERLFPGSAPLPSGRVAWRGVAQRQIQAPLPMVQLWMGAGAHLVAYPVTKGTRTNLVVTLPDRTDDNAVLTGASLAAQLAAMRWPPAACDLVASADLFTRYPLLTVPPLPVWHTGRVALLGDAAHAMLPFAAQGAAMAIEDASVLAACIFQDAVDMPAALARYTAARRDRLARVTATAKKSGWIYHLGGPMAVARDAAIHLLGNRRLLKRQEWIYDWRGAGLDLGESPR